MAWACRIQAARAASPCMRVACAHAELTIFPPGSVRAPTEAFDRTRWIFGAFVLDRSEPGGNRLGFLAVSSRGLQL